MFPVRNPTQGELKGRSDAFVAKVSGSGASLLYATYLGGSLDELDDPSNDEATDISVDSTGTAYIVGTTNSTDFPLANARQGSLGGGTDAFVAKLSTTGSGLIYSSYLGGSSDDAGGSIAIDDAGYTYVVGTTDSVNFPVANAIQSGNGGNTDAFIAKLNPSGSQFVYSTYLGGSEREGLANAGYPSPKMGVAADAEGNAYVSGETASTYDFPVTPNALQPTFGGGGLDAFVTKIDPTGSAPVYSTYLGGAADDSGGGIAADSAGNAYLTGRTYSYNFPVTAGAAQPANAEAPDAFITKIDPTGSAPVYSTYLGGDHIPPRGTWYWAEDSGVDLTIDASGNAYVVGWTRSADFPLINYFAPNGQDSLGDAFLTKLNSSGSAFSYSSTYGSKAGITTSQVETARGVAVNSAGTDVYVGGYTQNLYWDHFATVNALQPRPGGGNWDGILFKVSNSSPPSPSTNAPLPAELRCGGSPSQKPTTLGAGDLINTATGYVCHSPTDLAIPGRGVPLNFARTYNSDLNTYSGPLGYGWTHNYNMRIERDASNNYLVHEENGAVTTFTPSFGHDPRVLATLSYNSSTAEYLFTRIHGQVKYYFKEVGSGASRATKLVRIVDRNGLTTSLAYDGKARLTTVTEPNQRRLTLGYSGNNNPLISTVTDTSSGRVGRFEYLDGAGNLTKVTDVGNEITLYSYDASHRLDKVTEKRNGANTIVLDNDYDTSNRVTKQSYPMGRYLELGYVGASTRMTNTLGLITIHQYTYNKIDKVIDQPGATADQAIWEYTYEPGSTWVATATDPNHNLSTYTWDANGNLLTATDPLYRTTKYAYNPTNDITVITHTNTLTTTFAYDTYGNPLKVTRLLTETGQPMQVVSTTLGYDYSAGRAGDVLTSTNALGHAWHYTYDAYGYPRSASDPLGHTSYTYYDSVGRLYGSKDARGNPTNYSNNAYGQLVSVTNALSYTTVYTYDAVGNLIYTRDPKGQVITNTYNLNNELTRVTQPDGAHTDTEYDGVGRVLTETNALGQPTRYVYDDPSRTVTVFDTLNRRTKLTYDGAGLLRTMTEPDVGNRSTTYDYYKDNLLRAIRYSDSGTPDVSYTYNTRGLRASMSDGTGTTTYGYDSLDRLRVIRQGNGGAVDYGYDLANNLTSIQYPASGDGYRRVITRTFDIANRMETLNGPDHGGPNTGSRLLATFGYDGDDNLTSITTPDDVGFSRTFGYDRVGQVITNTYTLVGGVSRSRITTYSRDDLGLVGRSYEYNPYHPLWPRPIYTNTFAYDNRNRLESDFYEYYDDPSSTLTSTRSGWAMDAANQVKNTTVTASNQPTVTVGYNYDNANQITVMTQTTTLPLGGANTSRGSLLRLSPAARRSSTWLVAPGSPEAPQDSQVVTRFSYTNSGNRTQQGWHGGGTPITETLQYDQANRLVSYNPGNSIDPGAQYKYNGDGLRMEKRLDGAASITSTWDIAQGLPLLLQDLGNGKDAIYLYGPGGMLIGHLSPPLFLKPSAEPSTPTTAEKGESSTGSRDARNNGSASVGQQAPKPTDAPTPVSGASATELDTYHYYFYNTDQAGSIRQMVSHNEVAAQYSYDAYGNRTCQTLSGGECTENTPFGFTGQYQDEESGLLYMRARYYDPLTQQFLTRDPSGLSGGEPYVYANRNPVNYTDPTGAVGQPLFGGRLAQVRDEEGGGDGVPPWVGGGGGPRMRGARSNAGAAQKATQGSRGAIRNRAPGGSGAAYDLEEGQGIYVYVDEQGNVRYVGRGDAPGRASDHTTSSNSAVKTSGERLRQIIVANNNLAAAEAQGLEELLIVHYGGPRSRGGTLLNRDGAISFRNAGRRSMLRAAAPLFLEATNIIDSMR
jgi:RHS repeat-associated protein